MNDTITMDAKEMKELFQAAGLPSNSAYSVVQGLKMGHPELIGMAFTKHVKRLYEEADEAAAAARRAARRQEEAALDEMETLSAQIAEAMGNDPAHPDTLRDRPDREQLRTMYREEQQRVQIMEQNKEQLEKMIGASMGIYDE